MSQGTVDKAGGKRYREHDGTTYYSFFPVVVLRDGNYIIS